MKALKIKSCLFLSLVFIAFFAVSSCVSESQKELKLIFSDAGGKEQVYTWIRDAEGKWSSDKPHVIVDAYTNYDLALQLFENGKNVTADQVGDGTDWFVVLESFDVALSFGRKDFDAKNLPIGMESMFNTHAPSSGSARLRIKENVDKTMFEQTGELVADITFKLTFR